MPFLTEKAAPEKHLNVAATFGKTPKKGEVGLEVEVEGNKFPKPEGYEMTHQPVAMPSLKGWSYVHDGSLRGADNAEYVLTKPIGFDEVPEAVDTLYRGLSEYGSKLDNSHRTSTHVHLNVLDFYLNRLTSLMALYLTFEEVLTQWCGEHRVGNLFCLRGKDAPAIVTSLRRFIQSDMAAPVKDYNKYAGMNSSCISRLGSLEFRALRGVPEPDAILEWVGILRRLYEVSAEYSDPREICHLFSGLGPLPFFEQILGGQDAVVMKGVDLSGSEVSDSLLDGIRMAQDLCFCRDWSRFQELDIKPDPFRRDIRGIVKRLQGEEAEIVASGFEPQPEYDENEEDYDAEDEIWEPDEDDEDEAPYAPAPSPVSPAQQLAQAQLNAQLNAQAGVHNVTINGSHWWVDFAQPVHTPN